jgi:hypothetical protein
VEKEQEEGRTEQIEVVGGEVLGARDPLEIGDGWTWRDEGGGVEETVLGFGKGLAGAPDGEHGEL